MIDLTPPQAPPATDAYLRKNLQIAAMCELISTANFDRDDLGHRNTPQDESDILMRDLIDSGLATLTTTPKGLYVSALLEMFEFHAIYTGRKTIDLNDAILAKWQREARLHLEKCHQLSAGVAS